MKRLTTVCLALLMVLTLLSATACSKTLTAFERYTKAMEKLAQMDAVDAVMTMNIKMEMTGMTMELPMNYEIKAKGLKGDSPEMRVLMDMTVMGQSVKTDVYMKDGWHYYSMEDVKYKIRADKDDSMDLDSVLKKEATLTEELLKDVAVTEEDGLSVIRVTLSGEQILSMYKSLTESATEGLTVVAENISDATVSMALDKDGNLVSETVCFKMTISEPTVGEMKMDMEAVVTYRNIGKDVTVEAPEGYESYEEDTGLIQ